MLCAFVIAATAFGPGARVPVGAQVQRSSVAPRMSLTTPSETIDMVAGTVRPQTPVTEEMMRPRPNILWEHLAKQLEVNFGMTASNEVNRADLLKAYHMMTLCRQFENGCNQAYMQGLIRGFMHLDNGQETIPAFLADTLKNGDIKVSYYREHTHAIASGVPANKIMAELMMKLDGTCKGTGGSMHIYDKDTNFQGGWALVAEQLPYAVGGARSILLDRELGKVGKDDDRIAVVFVGEGGAQNGRMAECLNAAGKENLPILFVVIDNGRAINTFTPDVAQNSEVFTQGSHYGVPGIKVDGGNLMDTMRTGRAVIDYVRKSGPAIMQIHTYRLTGHSPADPEHERGRKAEKKWARAEADPIKLFEATGALTEEEMEGVQKQVKAEMQVVMEFAKASPFPPKELAKELEFPDAPDTDYNLRAVENPNAAALTERLLSPAQRATVDTRIAMLTAKATDGTMSIGDACNLAILEEMLRDPTVVIHAEDLQAGSSYDIPALTQQTFGKLRAADEIIDEGHFLGKALGEGLNGAGGTAPDQALGAEHSQPFHAYVMGIPGLKICTAASPAAAYGITKSMIRDNGPCILFCPVKMMKEAKSTVDVGKCLPLNKAVLLHKASDASVAAGKAVTVLTYLHGVKESQYSIEAIQAETCDIDLIQLRSLKPLDFATIKESLLRTVRPVFLFLFLQLHVL
ncbi:pyruvate dehydrogenase [Pavlovales sp. CCMP2436]|nr:pyruvate dehydrogenase [Pavlovales sp. CCMP2436]